MIIWAIWTARNSLLFQQQFIPFAGVISRAWSLYYDFQRANKNDDLRDSLGTPCRNVPTRWQLPQAGTYKLNVEGAFKTGVGGLGIMVHDSVGDVIVAVSIPLAQLINPQHAEILAVVHAHEFARDLSLSHYVVESDCE